MKKYTTLATLFVLIVAGSTSVLASNYMWWSPPDSIPAAETSESIMSSTKGNLKALVIVSRFPEDTVEWYPPLYDSLIAPSTEWIDSSKYQWSISNYLDVASWGQYVLTGDVNPTLDYHYIIAPCSLRYYVDTFRFSLRYGDTERIDSLEADLIDFIDDRVDLNDYDADSDGYVDFVFFIHAYNPQKGLWNYDRNCPDSGNSGYRDPNQMTFMTDVPRDGYPGQYMKIKDCVHIGSAMSFYHPVPRRRIDRAKAGNLCCHELGHAFGLGQHLKDGSGDIVEGLPDRYEAGADDANSCGVGKYTVMQMGYFTPHPQLYDPWERMNLNWIEPTIIRGNAQNMVLRDFNSNNPNIYLIPVDSIEIDTVGRKSGDTMDFRSIMLNEYFILANYQPSTTHWMDDMGYSFPDEFDTLEGPDPNAHGVLIWHVNERFWHFKEQHSEFAKFEDLECAEGLMNLNGSGPSPWGTEAGWDRIDRWAKRWNDDATIAWAQSHQASTSHPHDFFNPGYMGAFHTLTNPSSDGYNCDLRMYHGSDTTWGGYTYPYPSGKEILVLQNLPTHVSIEGIQYNGDNIQMCVRRSRIWTDLEDAMDRTTQRKFLCDTTDTFHFIYPLRGRIFYTKTHAPDSIWYKAQLVGPKPVYYDSTGYGIWPAITLDESREPLAVFYDTSCGKVLYSYREVISQTIRDGAKAIDTLFDTLWISPPCTLAIVGDPGPVAIDYGYGEGDVVNPDTIPALCSGSGPGAGTVHLAYITRVGAYNKVMYSCFHKTTPSSIHTVILDSTIYIDETRDLGASIDLDLVNDKICIAYGLSKIDTLTQDTIHASYYIEKTDLGWFFPPWRFGEGISDTLGEPLVPFVDIDGDSVRVVFNGNDRIHARAKTRDINMWNPEHPGDTSYNPWTSYTLPLPDSLLDGDLNRYPQIAGHVVAWTNEHLEATTVNRIYGFNCKSPSFFVIDSAYCPNSYFCQATKIMEDSIGYMYQHGTFAGPKWAIYYRSPNGFGGNQQRFTDLEMIPDPFKFTMFIPGNVLNGNQFSIFTTAECHLAIYDVTGRRVEQVQVEPGRPGTSIETRIDCQNWSSGIYFVRAIHENDNQTLTETRKVLLLR